MDLHQSPPRVKIEKMIEEPGDKEILGSYLNIEQDEEEHHDNTLNINQSKRKKIMTKKKEAKRKISVGSSPSSS